MSENIIRLAGDYSRYFVEDTRNDGSEFVKVDGAPEALTDLIREAHGGMLPDDFRYAFIREAIDAIAEAGEDDDLEDVGLEIEADIYTSELVEWLSSHAYRLAYCDDAASEFGFSGMTETMQAGQAEEKREVFNSVLESLREIAGE